MRGTLSFAFTLIRWARRLFSSMHPHSLPRASAWLAGAGLAASLAGCSKAVVLQPAGDIAAQQGNLVVQATLLMLIILSLIHI